jgi:predicted permease
MSFAAEVHYAVRSLTRSPVFAVVAVFSLALGIGANTAVFTLLDHVLSSQLPVHNPDELVQLKEVGAHYGSNTGMNVLSYPIYEDFRDQNQVFSGTFCRRQTAVSLTDGGRHQRVSAELVSGTYFPVLGVRAFLGRVFTPEEDRTRSGAPLAVLGYDHWRTGFGADPSIVGREILVNGHKLTVVGVAQPGFLGTERLFPTQVYIPIMMAQEIDGKRLDNRRYRWVQVFARRKPGVSLGQAAASLQPIFHRILAWEVQQKEFSRASAYAREEFLRMTLQVIPGGRGQNVAEEALATPLWALMGMVGLLLLIACANVANLMVARSTARQREVAVRVAMGASRGRIIRQFLTEGALLSLTGGLLGFAIAPWTMRLLNDIIPQMDPPVSLITAPNLRVLCFTLAACALTALLFGLAPALRASRPDLASTLKDEAGAVAGGGQANWRRVLVVAQIGLSLLLLIAAGLLVRSLSNLGDVNPGFDVHHLLIFTIGSPKQNGDTTEGAKLVYQRATRELAALPGVQSAALCVVAPLTFDQWENSLTVEGHVPKRGEDTLSWVNFVSPGFLATLKIPLFAGRDFSERDATGAPKVAIVNQKFARYYFGDGAVVGRHIGMGADPGTKTDIEIIGVVGDTKYHDLRAPAPRQVFFPYLQNNWVEQMTAYIRTDLAASSIFPVLRDTVRGAGAGLPVYLMKTGERQRDDSVSVEKLAATLAGAFGVFATVLAAIGLYGVTAFLVARRTREIGIRMALGAGTGNVVWLVVREVLLLVGIGAAVGLPAALALTRLLASQLYDIAPGDPNTVVVATLGIAAVAALSAYIPARRATRVDPVTALRYE